MSRRILVVDDETSILHSLEGILQDEEYETALATSGEAALESIEVDDPDLVLLDVWLPGIDGLETLERVRAQYAELPVVMMSGHGTIETAVRATKLGAQDFIEKPLNLDKVLLCIENALKTSRLAEENRYWRNHVSRRYEMVGDSSAMRELKDQIRVVAPTKASVLVTGENGTGKELVARAVHAGSKRREHPFVEVNCAAIPEEMIESELFGHERGAFTGATARRRGRFDLADGGTVFLDEIGDMSFKTQAKILRVLQEMRFERLGGHRAREVDVRVIAATNKDLEQAIATGHFREDLYFRLNVVPVHVPPLRDRVEDLPALVEHFIRLFSIDEKRDPVELGGGVVEALQAHSWPGNVRELKNVTERMVILCKGPQIRLSDLPPALQSAASGRTAIGASGGGVGLKEARKTFERQFILRHLEDTEWNVAQTADKINVDKSSLYKKIKELDIDLPDG